MELRNIEEELEAIAREYRLPRASEVVPQVTSSRRESSPTSLSPRPLAHSRSSAPARDSKENSKTESKAVAGAMKALQEKIRTLESSNERLRRDFEQVEARLRSDRETWAHQSARETEGVKSRETTYLRHIQALEEELKKEQRRAQDVQEAVGDLRQQSEQDKREADMRERSLQERIEMLLKQVDQKNKEILLFERNLDSIEKERTRFLTENSALAMQVTRLTSEIEFLKQGSDSARLALVAKVQESENFLRQRCDEAVAKCSDLEVVNARLKDLLAQKDRMVELAKIESMHEATQRSFLSESLTALRAAGGEKERKQQTPKKGKKRQKDARSQRKDPQPTPPREPAHKSATKGSNSALVRQLEQEIQQLNSAYKDFLQRADSLDLQELRGNLNRLSVEIEEKDRELARLKKQG